MNEDVLRRCLAKFPEFEPFENPAEAAVADPVERRGLSLAALDSGLPDTFKAGVCLALSQVIIPKMQSPRINPWQAIPRKDANIRNEDYLRPSPDPIRRAFQIGSVLSGLEKSIMPFISTPAVLIKCADKRSRQTPPSLASYYAIQPNGLTITIHPEAHQLAQVQLEGIASQQPSKYLHRVRHDVDAEPEAIPIPHLEQLVRGVPFSPQKLILGRDVSKFARQHKKEQVNWADKREKSNKTDVEISSTTYGD